MKSQTSLIAEQTRLKTWAEQIKDCQSRPKEMTVEAWCGKNGITKANYYYRLKRVRKAYLDHVQSHKPQTDEQTSFVELPVPVSSSSQDSDGRQRSSDLVAIFRGKSDLSLEIYSAATPELINSLIGALNYAE